MVERVEFYDKAMWKTSFDRSKIETLLTEAYKVHDAPLNEAAATVWGTLGRGMRGSSPPEGGNFEALAQDRLNFLLPSRLDPSRIDKCINPENPERDKLLGLAAGMEVDLPEGFTPNGETPETRSPLHKMYIKAHLAVDCMFFAMFTAGLAFIFRREKALKIPVSTSLPHTGRRRPEHSRSI